WPASSSSVLARTSSWTAPTSGRCRRSPSGARGFRAFLLLVVLPPPPPPAGEAQLRSFAIERFAVTLEVGADATLRVREAITVDFRGSHQRIFRTIDRKSTRLN